MRKLLLIGLLGGTVLAAKPHLGRKPHFQACGSFDDVHTGCFPPTSKHDALVQAHALAEQYGSPYEHVWVQDTRKPKKASVPQPDAPPAHQPLTEGHQTDKI